jgi:hypothetical protein
METVSVRSDTETALYEPQIVLLTVPQLWSRAPTLKAVTSKLVRHTAGAALRCTTAHTANLRPLHALIPGALTSAEER